MPALRCWSPKPCWIRRRFRWGWAESSDDRPEAGSRRFGYRRIWQLLRREGLHVNHKRVYRICHLNGLGVKRRRRRKGPATERLPLLRPDAPNLTWSMDFVMAALAAGRRIKCLTCVDDFTKECLTVTVAFGISGV